MMSLCLIVLTYKRKLLLKRVDSLSLGINPNNWSFIENRLDNQEITILKEVEEETKISLSSVKLISTFIHTGIKIYFYHAGLTDKNVNEIKRSEGKELQFFSLQEVRRLRLCDSSRKFFSDSQSQIEALAV